MIHWIVDGNNLIHSDPQFRQRMKENGFEAARALLEHELSRLRNSQETFEIVYDGGNSLPARSGVESSIARSGKTADDRVLALARKRGGRGQVRVVTDDRSDIGSRLSGSGVEWVSCAEFRQQVLKGGSGQKPNRGQDSGKPTPPRSKKQVDYWLQEFGVNSEEE
ncbi:MAG: NYN domain-containing protein [Planctomycetota bacterium]|nr:NYN domain-containing protein [Planctomycetota bacterium]